jgi:hypothetical protein
MNVLHPQSRIRDMQQISPDKLDRLQYATAGFTTRVLDGHGLRYHLLARPSTLGLRSSSCTSARIFAPRFLRTSPRDDALALHYHFPSIRL